MFLYATCLAQEKSFLDLTGKYPEEQQQNFYFLYINDKPFTEPYLTYSPTNSKDLIYYLPAKELLDALKVSGTYDKKTDKILINGKEFPKDKSALGRNLKTNEKILYLSFKDVLSFLKLPMRIQETSLGVTYHTRTDGSVTSFQNTSQGSDNPAVITWYNSIKDAQPVAQSSGKNILVKFGALW